jgi:hypothetical protein
VERTKTSQGKRRFQCRAVGVESGFSAAYMPYAI